MHGLHNFFLAYKSSNTIPLGSPTNRRTPHDLGGITSLTPYLSLGKSLVEILTILYIINSINSRYNINLSIME
jgi:hypothetical protein